MGIVGVQSDFNVKSAAEPASAARSMNALLSLAYSMLAKDLTMQIEEIEEAQRNSGEVVVPFGKRAAPGSLLTNGAGGREY